VARRSTRHAARAAQTREQSLTPMWTLAWWWMVFALPHELRRLPANGAD